MGDAMSSAAQGQPSARHARLVTMTRLLRIMALSLGTMGTSHAIADIRSASPQSPDIERGAPYRLGPVSLTTFTSCSGRLLKGVVAANGASQVTFNSWLRA